MTRPEQCNSHQSYPGGFTEADVLAHFAENDFDTVLDRHEHEQSMRDNPEAVEELQRVVDGLRRESSLPTLTQKQGAVLDAMARSNVDAPITGPDLFKTEHLASSRYEYDKDTGRVLRRLRDMELVDHVARRGYMLRRDREPLRSGKSWCLFTRRQQQLLSAFSWKCIELALTAGRLSKPQHGESMRLTGPRIAELAGVEYNGDTAKILKELASARIGLLAHERGKGFWVNQWPDDAELRPHWSVVVGGVSPSTSRSELVRDSVLRAIARATREVVCPIRRRDFIHDRTLRSVFRANRLLLQRLRP